MAMSDLAGVYTHGRMFVPEYYLGLILHYAYHELYAYMRVTRYALSQDRGSGIHPPRFAAGCSYETWTPGTTKVPLGALFYFPYEDFFPKPQTQKQKIIRHSFFRDF
jgi:hypothetical protein